MADGEYPIIKSQIENFSSDFNSFKQASDNYERNIIECKQKISSCNSQIKEYLQLKNNINQIESSKETQIMVPLGPHAYLPSRLYPSNLITLSIGLSYYIEFSFEDALKFIDRRLGFLQKSNEITNSLLQENEKKINIIQFMQKGSDIIEVKENAKNFEKPQYPSLSINEKQILTDLEKIKTSVIKEIKNDSVINKEIIFFEELWFKMLQVTSKTPTPITSTESISNNRPKSLPQKNKTKKKNKKFNQSFLSINTPTIILTPGQCDDHLLEYVSPVTKHSTPYSSISSPSDIFFHMHHNHQTHPIQFNVIERTEQNLTTSAPLTSIKSSNTSQSHYKKSFIS